LEFFGGFFRGVLPNPGLRRKYSNHENNQTQIRALPLALLLGFDIQMIQAQTRFDEIANLPFSENRPTAETAKT
jgi:hypothetical protein